MKTSDHDATQRLVIALGDPAGIGMEVTLKALASPELPQAMKPMLVGCRRTLLETHDRLRRLGCTALADPEHLTIDDRPLIAPIQPGQGDVRSGEASFHWLTVAVDHLVSSGARALVTAPIAKHLWHAAGHIYPGQTERLAELAGSPHASMLFTARSPLNGWRLNTLLATTHIPLQQVPDVLNEEVLVDKLDALLAFCQRFLPRPPVSYTHLTLPTICSV